MCRPTAPKDGSLTIETGVSHDETGTQKGPDSLFSRDIWPGDWSAFLRYIGEQPEAEERITTALPEPKLYVQAEDRASAIAATHGVAPTEVKRMLSLPSGVGTGSPCFASRTHV